jgi:hypothetical protein
MPRQILCTVGTSLLTNLDDRPWAGWNPRTLNPLPDAESVDRWLRTADTMVASAETNTLARLDVAEADILVLMHSDTPEGRFCAEHLRTLYSTRSVKRCSNRSAGSATAPLSSRQASKRWWM